MNVKHIELLHTWFDSLNRGDTRALLPLFSPECHIQNAADPPDKAPGAADRLLTSFFRRTESRRFELVDFASSDRTIHACWSSVLTFHTGIAIADVTLPAPLVVVLNGVDVFELNAANKIARLFITHETTSVIAAARRLTSAEKSGPTNLESQVLSYFRAEECGDAETIVGMCDERVMIINAAQPPAYGLDGARRFVEDFRSRTTRRLFQVCSLAVRGTSAFAEFRCRITFREGAQFGPAVRAQKEFTVELQGVCRFEFNATGKLIFLRIFHETSTAFKLANAS
jgi:SnoaL-like domain